VPLTEKVEDLNDLPIICQIDDKRIFALNFSKEFEVERQRSFDNNSEECYYDLAKGIGLKKFEQKLLPSFAFKLMESLPGQGEFTGVQVGQSIGNVLR
jgi:polyhydroxyalkanoate synthesis regulator phasin